MTKLLTTSLLACGFALVASTLPATAFANTETAAAKTGSNAKAKGKGKSGPVKAQEEVAYEEPGPAPVIPEAEPDVSGTDITPYSCELGNTVTIYTNKADKDGIALRWKRRLHRLVRVGTTTGAHRFENKNFGLTWIGIPSKGMLLDSRLNRQLANECKSPEQENPPVIVAPAAAVPKPIVAKPDPVRPVVTLPATLPPAAGTAPVVLRVAPGTQSVVVPVPAGTSAVVVPVPTGAAAVVVPVPVGTPGTFTRPPPPAIEPGDVDSVNDTIPVAVPRTK